MEQKLETLKDTVSIIKKLGIEVGMEITEEEIARKMSMSLEQLEAYLNSANNTPNEVLAQVWAAYDDVVKAVQRSNISAPIRNIINLIKDLGETKGIIITDEEIIERIAIPRAQFEAYLNGDVATPDEVLTMFWSAWPGLLKNIRKVSTVQNVTIIEEDMDKDVE